MLPSCPGISFTQVGTLVSNDATVNGTLNLRQVQFTSDLISKLYLFSTTYGVGISTGQLNVFFPSTAATVFQCGGTEVARIDATGLDVTGTVTSNSIPIYPLIGTVFDLGNPAVATKDYTFPSDARRVTVAWSNLQNTFGTYMVRLTLFSGTTVINATSMNQNYTNSSYSTTVVQLWNGGLGTWFPTYWFNGHTQFVRVGTSGTYVQWSISGLNGSYNGSTANISMTSGEFSTTTALPFNKVRISGGGVFDLGSYVAVAYE